ncbi:class I SAM-dependent methyltransferase [Streptacidiphilus melanogenes]|uniref:class I SAM-dependent methyltransferase n=1 Tax=Streptacidiphilus melanogenes TaxID=411235 RepID=UPI0005A9B952|nr:methyltransferase domain-containing protein [Streptacidiphilus melanogenes]
MVDTTRSALYDSIGIGYAAMRREDPRWRARILDAVGDAAPVLNVGAGAGSYEPHDRLVVALDPSAEMLAQRAPGAAPCVLGVAEQLPAADGAYGVAMGVLTVHHWPDWRRGLAELRRVAARQVIVATDTDRLAQFWLTRDYVPELAPYERRQVTAHQVAAELGTADVRVLPLPRDFSDAVYPAFWRRPEAFLNEELWRHSSALARLDPSVRRRALTRLAADLADGTWHERNADLMELDEFDAGFRLVVRDGDALDRAAPPA